MEPFGERLELIQFLVCMVENLVGEEVETIKGFDNSIQLRRVQTEDITEFVEFGQAHEAAQ